MTLRPRGRRITLGAFALALVALLSADAAPPAGRASWRAASRPAESRSRRLPPRSRRSDASRASRRRPVGPLGSAASVPPRLTRLDRAVLRPGLLLPCPVPPFDGHSTDTLG